MIALILAAAVATQQPAMQLAQVTYVSGPQIYVGAGRSDGIVEGMELALLRGDTVAAVLRVQFVSSRQAACVVVRGATDVTPGERVRFTPANVVADSAPPATVATPNAAPARVRREPRTAGLHGRLGGRYGYSQLDGAGNLTQPALDVRLSGSGLGGTALGLIADVRARSSQSSLAGGLSSSNPSTDVYQLALLWQQPGAPFRVAVGRQYVAGVSSIVLLDGALLEVSRRRVSLGLFGGLEPLGGDSAAPGRPRDIGGYVRVRSGTAAFTLGAAGSYAAGQPNREFGFAALNVVARRFSVFASQQLDYYRAAKVAVGEPTLSLTSGYVSASVRATASLTLDAGFDQRRNVRLYRDVTNPLQVFDDSYRRAAWGAIGLAGRRLRLRLEARGSDGGTAGGASAITASAGAAGLRRGLDAAARVTRYHAANGSGWLGALQGGIDVLPVLRVAVNGGLRRDIDPPVALGARSNAWYGVETNLSVGRAWYAVVSLSREVGPDGAVSQAYTSVSWRF